MTVEVTYYEHYKSHPGYRLKGGTSKFKTLEDANWFYGTNVTEPCAVFFDDEDGDSELVFEF